MTSLSWNYCFNSVIYCLKAFYLIRPQLPINSSNNFESVKIFTSILVNINFVNCLKNTVVSSTIFTNVLVSTALGKVQTLYIVTVIQAGLNSPKNISFKGSLHRSQTSPLTLLQIQSWSFLTFTCKTAVAHESKKPHLIFGCLMPNYYVAKSETFGPVW